MKKTTLSLLQILFFVCGSNLFAQESFKKIDIRGNANIIITQGSLSVSEPIKVSEFYVSDETLIIGGNYSDDIKISLPELSSINISGRGTVTGDFPINVTNLNLNIDGDGKINLRVNAQNINANVNGFGKLTLSGSAESTSLSIPGSGKIEAMDLKTRRCNVMITGMGKCNVDVTDELNSTITGNGVVNYKSEPIINNKNITGLGSVKSSGGSADTTSSGNEVSDTTHIDFGERQLYIVGKKKSDKKKNKIDPIWSGLELGINSYMDNGGTFTLRSDKTNFELRTEKSVSFAINFLEKHVELGSSNIYLFTGLGVTWNNYRFENDVVLQDGDFITAIKDSTSGVTRLKSKLVASYLTAPVMLEVFTSRNSKKAVHLGVGAMLGLRVGSHTKQVIEVDGDESKVKVHDDFNLNPFRYGFRVAIGYGHFNIFADYYASPLFKDKKGPVLFPVNAGITMVGF